MYDDLNFQDLYGQNRNKFVNWAKSWTGLAEHDIIDIFQDACVILWQKMETGNLVLTAKPTTFLFGIGRNLLRERLRERNKEPKALPDGLQITDEDIDEVMSSPEEDMIRLERNSCLEKIIDQLGEGCANVIKLTFYHEKNSKEIAEIAGYASGDVVRQMRRRCLKQLKELYKKHCI